MYQTNASQHLYAKNSEVRPTTPKKSKPKNDEKVTPRKSSVILNGRYFASLWHTVCHTLLDILYSCYPVKIGFIYTLKSKKAHEANELLLELHEFNYNRQNGLDRTEVENFYILWLMNWFSDGIVRKQKATLYRREIANFPKECFIINFELN